MAKLVSDLAGGHLPGLGTEYCCVEGVFDEQRAREQRVQAEARGLAMDDLASANARDGTPKDTKARSLGWQMYILTRRSYANQLRSPDFVQRQLLMPMLQYLFFGALYSGTRYLSAPTPDGFTSTDLQFTDWTMLSAYKRSFYFQVMSIAILSETSVMAEAHGEQRAFRREHAAGAYSIYAYHLQWMMRLNFRAIWLSILFSAIVFFFPENALNFQRDEVNALDQGVAVGSWFGMWAFFVVIMCVCSTVGSALALLFISLIPDAEGAAGAHNAISAVLLQYSGYYLLPCLMPPFVNIAYFISFGKYAFEAMLLNEFTVVPYGSQWTLYNSVLNSIDPSLTRWTNLLVLVAYPFIFHALALLSSFLQTRPKSYWAPLEDRLHEKFPNKFRRREDLAHADPDYRHSRHNLLGLSSAEAEALPTASTPRASERYPSFVSETSSRSAASRREMSARSIADLPTEPLPLLSLAPTAPPAASAAAGFPTASTSGPSDSTLPAPNKSESL